jgi:polysaccharide biosynthesis protein PslH
MRMLVLTARLFYPATTGGRIRSSQLFERLARVHDLTMVCFKTADEGPDRLQAMRACCARLETVPLVDHRKGTLGFFVELARNILSPQAFTIAKYDVPAMRRLIADLLRREHYDVLICDFLHPSPNVLSEQSVPKILFQHNVESMIRQRHYHSASNLFLRAYLYWDWVRLKRFEHKAVHAFDHCIMVSEQDSEALQRLFGAVNSSSIPTGVDVDYFQSREPEASGHHIVFTGSMDWFANEDAVHFFVRDVLPRIREQLDVTFWVVGRTPTKAVRALADEQPFVRVTGTVDDVRPYMDRAAVYVVPLRIGGGTRIKIFEAMAMGKPVVSTTIGAEGLPVSHGQNVILADDPAQFASDVIRLLTSRAERRRIGDAARALVVEHYTWDVAARRFSDICEAVVTTTRRP